MSGDAGVGAGSRRHEKLRRTRYHGSMAALDPNIDRRRFQGRFVSAPILAALPCGAMLVLALAVELLIQRTAVLSDVA